MNVLKMGKPAHRRDEWLSHRHHLRYPSEYSVLAFLFKWLFWLEVINASESELTLHEIVSRECDDTGEAYKSWVGFGRKGSQ